MLNSVVHRRGMSSTCTFILLVILCVHSSHTKKIPSYITLCHRADPDLNGCLRKAVQQIRPYLAKGVPELLIPPMDPLVLPQAGLDSGNNFKAGFKNIEIFYANEFKLDHLNFDLDKLHVELGLSFPKLRIKSQYNIDGRLLVLQLSGKGPADGNFTSVTAKVVLDGQLQPRKGKDYIDLSVTSLDLGLGKPVFLFENMFGDNQELNDRTNKVINENIVDILDELRPVIDKAVIEFAFGIIKRLFNRFSVDELFPK